MLDDNKMYLHEVHTTKAESVMPFKTPDLQGGKTRSDTYTLPPIYSIFNKLVDVNGESQLEKVKLQLEDADIDPNEVERLQEQYRAGGQGRIDGGGHRDCQGNPETSPKSIPGTGRYV